MSMNRSWLLSVCHTPQITEDPALHHPIQRGIPSVGPAAAPIDASASSEEEVVVPVSRSINNSQGINPMLRSHSESPIRRSDRTSVTPSTPSVINTAGDELTGAVPDTVTPTPTHSPSSYLEPPVVPSKSQSVPPSPAVPAIARGLIKQTSSTQMKPQPHTADKKKSRSPGRTTPMLESLVVKLQEVSTALFI